MSHWILIIVAVVLGGLGGIVLVIAVVMFFQHLALHLRGRRVMATVLGYRGEEQEFTHHDVPHRGPVTTTVTFQVPILTFTDEEGEDHEVEVMGTMKKRLRKGESVVLIYSPGNPKTCVVDAFFDKWVPVLVSFLVSLVLLGFPAFLLFN